MKSDEDQQAKKGYNETANKGSSATEAQVQSDKDQLAKKGYKETGNKGGRVIE